jgi:hypothetical protein
VLVSVHAATDFSSLSKRNFTTASDMSHEDAPTLPSGGRSVAPRGLSFTPEEDLMIAQAYCAASEDSIRGDYQKADDIKEKMRVNYTELCIEYTKINHASLTHSAVNNRRTNKQLKTAPVAPYKPGDNMFVLRTADSIWKRFKTKIGRDCMAMSGVAASHPRLSGENDDQYWERLVTEFENREGVKFKFPKIYDYLKEKPKWKVYCDEVSSLDTKRKGRPKGAKSAKRLESDKARVARVVEDLTIDDPANNQPPAANSNQRHDELIKMIEGQSKSLYQFGLMLTSSTLSPARKKAAIDHSLEDLETKRLANEEKKIQLEEKKIELKERKLALMRASADAKRPRLLESSEEESDTNNDDDKP